MDKFLGTIFLVGFILFGMFQVYGSLTCDASQHRGCFFGTARTR
jgi:hypothetical protein